MSEFDLVEYEPTEVIKITISDLTVPMNTAIELQKLALVEKGVLVELLKDAERHEESGKLIMHPETLYWAKELRMIIKDIDVLTKGVQEKAMLKKMDIVGDLYKQILKNASDTDLVKLIKKLERNDTVEISTLTE